MNPELRYLFESLPVEVKNELLTSGEDLSTRDAMNAAIMKRLYHLHPDQRDMVMDSIHQANHE